MSTKIIIISLSLLCLGLPVQSFSGERHDKSGYSSETGKAMVPGVNVGDETVVQVEMPQKGNFDRRVYRLPNTILKKITDKMKGGDWGCGENGDKIEIFSNHFFNLDNNKLLLLLGISEYLCGSNTFIPVTVDYHGKWEYGRFIEGEPTLLVKGSDNALWLNSQWQIEGTYPSLYRSTDGIEWQEVTLPENRNVDCCFEWLTQICFAGQRIRLKFYGDYTNKTEYWVAYVHDILKPIVKWHQLNHVDKHFEKECFFVPVTKGNWIRTESENTAEIRFQLKHNRHVLTVIIPKWIFVD